VHPEDERYAHLVGQRLKLPLTDREIPIVSDDYVDREFGTGCVKITPAHDFNDWALGARHGPVPISIFTLDAKVNENAPAKYQGLDRFAARGEDAEDARGIHQVKITDGMIGRSRGAALCAALWGMRRSVPGLRESQPLGFAGLESAVSLSK
jgi:hypothetical protein